MVISNKFKAAFFKIRSLCIRGACAGDFFILLCIVDDGILPTKHLCSSECGILRLLIRGVHAAAIELADGTLITSETSPLLGPSAALLLNATKHLAGIDHSVKLIPQEMIEPIQKTKVEYLGGNNPRLHTDEVLVALSVLSQHDDNCRRALTQLPELRGCQVHSTVMLSEVDRKIFKKLGCGLTCDPARKS